MKTPQEWTETVMRYISRQPYKTRPEKENNRQGMSVPKGQLQPGKIRRGDRGRRKRNTGPAGQIRIRPGLEPEEDPRRGQQEEE